MTSLKDDFPKDEYQQIISLLGKEPNEVELALFSAMWSEHCSYKSSKIHLKKFAQIKSSKVVAGFGENAGVIDLGEGEKIAFKMESHNHPSRIEPLHGAMTGVGGILRDIFAMNARPIALANYLCFGRPDYPITKHLVDGVVRGIGNYGNSIGIPTITGHTTFHSSYNENILVNALALGIYGPEDKIMRSQAPQSGAYVVYAGARTGRDGIHGASMASESFSDQTEKKQSTVQVGDPFYGKLLMEACLEAMKKNVLAAQDMGAAGLISSSFEMASKGNIGMNLQLDKVPLRDFSMKPEEILLSESQERMLLICSPENYPHLQKIFQKWSLPISILGETISERKMNIYWKDKLLTSIDPLLLTEKAPELKRPFKKWGFPNRTSKKLLNESSKQTFEKKLRDLLEQKENVSREFIYRQYDQRVGAKTAEDCSFPIGVIQLPYSKRFLGIVLGGRSSLLHVDALEGGKDSILYPGIQLALRGFKPLAVTDCLNFGNPEKEEIMSQFVGAIEGMVEAADALSTPVISGNVSFYNESSGANIIPTPAIGMTGLKEELSSNWPKSYFENKGEFIYLIQKHDLTLSENHFSGSLNAQEISKWIQFLISISDKLNSAKTVGHLGLAYTLTQMIQNRIGAKVEVDLDPFQTRLYEVIVTVSESKKEEFESLSRLTPIGVTTSDKILEYNKNKLSIDAIKEIQQAHTWI
ncbi:MAG: phosphoribosylformylglycinamidine synthase subunit PurL [Bdellovibrionales bacterium]|nr:phosphoribosylformylglycinamidine synthase subunit PurL [Bdellovibrionales bacterium]